MTDLLIGAGGWAYFRVRGLSPLEAYSRAFGFVEVNSTFYEIPSLRLVRSWRRRVPRRFEFSVRCHRDVTHRFKLEPVREAFEAFTRTREICGVLDSRFLVLETPASLSFSRAKVEAMRGFFGSLDLKGVRVVWEARTGWGEPLPPSVCSLMEDYKVIRCVDLSREDPAAGSDTVYTRVFGKGAHNVYQFTDEELLEIDRRVMGGDRGEAVISFHNVRMYKDAARYKTYKQRNSFPPVTRAKGQQALAEILMEDAEYPVTRQELIRDQGWKVIDLEAGRRVHAQTLLEGLPDGCFRSLDEVLAGLPKNG